MKPSTRIPGRKARKRLRRDGPRLYNELASWFHLLTHPKDYAEEAAFLRKVLRAAAVVPPKTLLELGSGGGNNASHLKKHFHMTLVDRSSAMLALSRTLNPECVHIRGDMRNLRLNRVFDAVLIHDAIMYMTNERDLHRAMETALVHCRPRGVALFAPDHVRESFRPETKHGGHDARVRSLRYLEWVWDPDPRDSTYIVDFCYLLRENGTKVKAVYDRHLFGLFRRRTWLALLKDVGFQASRVLDPFGRDLFVGLRSSR